MKEIIKKVFDRGCLGCEDEGNKYKCENKCPAYESYYIKALSDINKKIIEAVGEMEEENYKAVELKILETDKEYYLGLYDCQKDKYIEREQRRIVIENNYRKSILERLGVKG